MNINEKKQSLLQERLNDQEKKETILNLSKEELNEALKKAIEHRSGPVIIDAITEREENVWPMVPAGASLDEIMRGEI